jgi:hypothetical protein
VHASNPQPENTIFNSGKNRGGTRHSNEKIFSLWLLKIHARDLWMLCPGLLKSYYFGEEETGSQIQDPIRHLSIHSSIPAVVGQTYFLKPGCAHVCLLTWNLSVVARGSASSSSLFRVFPQSPSNLSVLPSCPLLLDQPFPSQAEITYSLLVSPILILHLAILFLHGMPSLPFPPPESKAEWKGTRRQMGVSIFVKNLVVGF